MGDVKLEALDRWLTHGYWVQDHEGVARVVGLSIKCEPQQILAVCKALTAEGPVVAFVQAKGLEHLYGIMGRKGLGDQVRWREDRFALDNLEKKR